MYTLHSKADKHSDYDDEVSYSQKEGFREKIESEGRDIDRFVPLVDETKQSYTNHKLRENQYAPGEIDGNYGFVFGGEWLGIDIDPYGGKEAPERLGRLFEEHPSIEVKTPHDGIHLYYPVTEDFAEIIKTVCGRYNPEFGAVEVKAKNTILVSPGSEIDGCTKHWCDESDHDPYRLDPDSTLNESFPEDEFLGIIEDLTEPGVDSTEDSDTSEAGELTLTSEVDEWLSTGRQGDDYLDQLMECLSAASFRPQDYPRIEHPDRSKVEVACARSLMMKFGAFDGYEAIVRDIMDGLHPPKWNEAGQSYQDSVLVAAKSDTVEKGKFYQPTKSGSAGSVLKPYATRISMVASDYEIDATFTTGEVAELIPEIGEQQTLKVLNDLKDAGCLSKTMIDHNEHFRKISEIDTNGKFFDMFLNRYNSEVEVREIQSDYLSEVNGNDPE